MGLSFGGELLLLHVLEARVCDSHHGLNSRRLFRRFTDVQGRGAETEKGVVGCQLDLQSWIIVRL